MKDLFNKSPEQLDAGDLSTIVSVYKMLVEMADKVSQRRQNANNFYLSVNSALVGASAYISTLAQKTPAPLAAISIAGALVSILWMRNIQSYKDLNEGKFAVINEIEKVLPIAPYSAEWEYLERGTNSKRYRPFHTVEVLVPLVFLGVHMVQLARNIPWAALCNYLSSST